MAVTGPPAVHPSVDTPLGVTVGKLARGRRALGAPGTVLLSEPKSKMPTRTNRNNGVHDSWVRLHKRVESILSCLVRGRNISSLFSSRKGGGRLSDDERAIGVSVASPTLVLAFWWQSTICIQEIRRNGRGVAPAFGRVSYDLQREVFPEKARRKASVWELTWRGRLRICVSKKGTEIGVLVIGETRG